LKDEHKSRVSGNKIRKIFGPTRDKVTGQFRILHNNDSNWHKSVSIVGPEAAQSV